MQAWACLGISCWVLIQICVCLLFSYSAQSNVTDSVLEVVAYEARRLFRDRLVSSKDLHTFDNILSSIIRGDWGSDALDNMTGMRQFNNKQIGEISLQIDCLVNSCIHFQVATYS